MTQKLQFNELVSAVKEELYRVNTRSSGSKSMNQFGKPWATTCRKPTVNILT